MHLPGVAELFFRGGGRRGLDELSKTRAGIGEAPRGQLNAKGFQRIENSFTLSCVHSVTLFGNEGYNPFPRQVTSLFTKKCSFA
jgi:hypothetical protein